MPDIEGTAGDSNAVVRKTDMGVSFWKSTVGDLAPGGWYLNYDPVLPPDPVAGRPGCGGGC